MPLPAPAPRKHLHTRTIKCEGYEREDGLYDIEAQIVDQKAYAVDEPISELLMPLATVAFQTLGSWKQDEKTAASGQRPHFIDGCHAWAADGPVVKKLYPMFYKGT